MATTELLDLARRSTRNQFIASCPDLLLVGSNILTPPARPAAPILVEKSHFGGDPTTVSSG